MNRPGFAFLISDLVGPYGPGGSAAYVGKLKLPDDVGEPVTASAQASVSVSGERQTKNG